MDFNKHKLTITILLGVAFSTLGGINWYIDYQKNQTLVWQKVSQQNDIANYQEYILSNPKYKIQAQKKITVIKQDELNFNNAALAQTELAMQHYLDNCQLGNCANQTIATEIIDSVKIIHQKFNAHLQSNDLSKGESGFALNDIEQLQQIVGKDEKIQLWTQQVADKYIEISQETQNQEKIKLQQKLAEQAKIKTQINSVILDLDKFLDDYEKCGQDCPDYIKTAKPLLIKYKKLKHKFLTKISKEHLTSAATEVTALQQISAKAKQIDLWRAIIAENFYKMAKSETQKKSIIYVNKGLKFNPDNQDLLKLQQQINTNLANNKTFKLALTAGTLSAMKKYLNNCNHKCVGKVVATTKITNANNLVPDFNRHISNQNLLYGSSGYALADLSKFKKLFPNDPQLAKWEKIIVKNLIKNIKTKIDNRQYNSAKKQISQALKVYRKNSKISSLSKLLKQNKYKNQFLVPTMVHIAGGGFTMGGKLRYSKPKRWVQLKSFNISKTEITFNVFKKYARTKRLKLQSNGWGMKKRPVINISWRQATSFAKWLSRKTNRTFRLPTEAEWEFVARNSKPLLSQTRINKASICKYANGADISSKLPWKNRQCRDGYTGKTAPVKSYLANKLGVHDMHGNVWEWTADCWHPNFKHAPKDNSIRNKPSNCRRKVIKGGGWNSSVIAMLPSYRSSAIKNLEYNYIGFRIVEEI